MSVYTNVSREQWHNAQGSLKQLFRLPSRSDYVYKPSMITPPLGIYRHYKGNLYQLLHIACHSETEEPLAVYRALYGDYGVWVRPLAMFTENVVTEQGSVARFALVKARWIRGGLGFCRHAKRQPETENTVSGCLLLVEWAKARAEYLGRGWQCSPRRYAAMRGVVWQK